MQYLLQDGRIVDVALAFMIVEIAVLIVLRRKLPACARLPSMLANLVSGASLLISLRVALTGGAMIGIIALLAISLVAHVADAWLRFQAPSSS